MQIVEWILELWASLPAKIIKQLFKSCALNINVDGSEDNVIHYFEESQPCAANAKITNGSV